MIAEVNKLSWGEKQELAKKETKWEVINPVKTLLQHDREIIDAVAARKISCPVCHERGEFPRELRGITTGLTLLADAACQCGRAQLIHVITEKYIPVHDRFIRLAKLEPSKKSQLSVEQQASVLADIRKNPKQSYAFFGPAGTSKTTFCVALYRERVIAWANGRTVLPINGDSWSLRAKSYMKDLSIYRVSAKKLLEDFHRESMGEVDEHGDKIHPVVNREKLAKYGEQAALFIEEIDKVHFTEFKTNAFFELFDACYEHGIQLVFNTNLTPEKFAAQFGPETGPAIFRRIAEICIVHNFFEPFGS